MLFTNRVKKFRIFTRLVKRTPIPGLWPVHTYAALSCAALGCVALCGASTSRASRNRKMFLLAQRSAAQRSVCVNGPLARVKPLTIKKRNQYYNSNVRENLNPTKGRALQGLYLSRCFNALLSYLQ